MAGAFLAIDWGITRRCAYRIEEGAATQMARGDRVVRAGAGTARYPAKAAGSSAAFAAIGMRAAA